MRRPQLPILVLALFAGTQVGAETAPAAAAFSPLTALPAVTAPLDNPITPAKVELGRLLFFDNRLSGDLTSGCAACHAPELGWGDGNPLSLGYPGTQHWRNSQTIVNSAFLQKLFWAGEVTSLETQAVSAATGNLAGNVDPAMAEERLAQVPEYVQRFRRVFGVRRPSFELAMKAIATFERTLTSSDSPFDRYMRGERAALSERALRGKKLFEGKAACIQCHNGALFSDEGYHALGVPEHPLFTQDPLRQIALRFQHYSRGVPDSVYRQANRDLGLYYPTGREADMGKFRTAPLRYLRYTAPYMHNGVFATLAEVVDFYDRGGGLDPSTSPLLKPLGLSDAEKQDLLAFLDSLSGTEVLMAAPELPPYVPTEPIAKENPR